jgi:hypothetical protein
MKEILDVIHKTIYQFFDICEDDKEVPMSDKDKLLLEVNKAICNNLKALEKEPCEDCISRQAVIDTIETDCSWDIFNEWGSRTPTGECIINAIKSVPSVEPERKTGKWVHMVGWWECDQCHAEYTDMPTCMGKVIYEYCPMCGCRMKEVEE